MKIRLFEVPEEGRSYTWSSQSGEINEILADLVGRQTYEVQFYLRPINSRDFELTGSIRTRVPELCSRCGDDIFVAIQARFHEILIPPQPEERTGKYAKVNHVSEIEDSGPESCEYDRQGQFDMGEFLHEVVAINTPLYPSPAADGNGKCGECRRVINPEPLMYEEKITPGPNAFAPLKNLKLQ